MNPPAAELQVDDRVHEMIANMRAELERERARVAVPRGPFKPDDATARENTELTKCRKCAWFNKFDHRNFTVLSSHLRRVGTDDWCHACGRIASVRDFGKKQSTPYQPELGDVSLGSKQISFGIKAHDPRKIEDFKKNWEEHEDTSDKWTYNDTEMEEDFFRHRIGKNPCLDRILLSVPVVAADSIPETAKVITSNYAAIIDRSNPAANETEALLLENDADLTLLRELHEFCEYNDVLGMILRAKWDKVQRQGVSDE